MVFEVARLVAERDVILMGLLSLSDVTSDDDSRGQRRKTPWDATAQRPQALASRSRVPDHTRSADNGAPSSKIRALQPPARTRKGAGRRSSGLGWHTPPTLVRPPRFHHGAARPPCIENRMGPAKLDERLRIAAVAPGTGAVARREDHLEGLRNWRAVVGKRWE